MTTLSQETHRTTRINLVRSTLSRQVSLRRKYLTFLLLLSGFAFIALTLSVHLFLRNVGEGFNAKDIVETQQAALPHKSLAGQKLTDFAFSYKKALTDRLHPTILALGSSRVAQFRQSFFTVPFVNAGVAMTNVEEGNQFFNDVIAGNDQKPQLVILGIDIWWFNDRYHVNNSTPRELPLKQHGGQNILFFPQSLHLVYEGIRKGTISVEQFMRGAFRILPDNYGIGVEGRFNMTGFGPDGSAYYIERVAGQSKGDLKFQDSLRKIQSGNPHTQFAHGASASHTRVHQFVDLLFKFKAQSIKTILFFTPFPQTIQMALANKKEEYAYIPDLKYALIKSGIPFYDFSDATILDSNDCEFFDGIHGGEIIYARIIKTIYDSDPSIRDFVDIQYLQQIIKQYRGHTFIPDNTLTSLEEVDFLELGCEKSKNSKKFQVAGRNRIRGSNDFQ